MYRRLKELRTDHDLTQETVSKYIHCSQRTYSDYERGIVTIPTEILSKLADFYNTSVDYIIGRTDQKKPFPPSAIDLFISDD